MKYRQTYRFVVLLLLFHGVSFAGGEQKQCNLVNLSQWEIQAGICIPAGIKVKEVNYTLSAGDALFFKKAEMMADENADFTAISKIMPTFAIQISDSGFNLKEVATEIESNDVNQLKKYITKSDSLLFYESEVMGKLEYHFVMNVSVNGQTYGIEDVKGDTFSRKQVEKMIAVAGTLRAL